MRGAILVTMMVGAIACGPASPASDEGTTMSSANTSDDGATTTSTSSTSGSDDTSSGNALDSSGSHGATMDDASSTGDPFTYSADETLVELACGEQGPRAWIEVYPDILDAQCLPSAGLEIDSVVLIVVEPWDGASGTFEVGADGPARVGLGASASDAPTGTLSLEVAEPWTLVSLSIDVSTSESSFTGTADLSMCGPADPADPCS